MEEDNAVDILKSLNDIQRIELQDDVFLHTGRRSFHANIRLRGNLLCCIAKDEPIEPLVFVLVKFHVRKSEEATVESRDGEAKPAVPAEFSHVFVIAFKNEELVIHTKSQEQREQWMVKIATCSYEMAIAELDEITYKLFSMNAPPSRSLASPSPISATDSSKMSFLKFFLTNSFRSDQHFSVSQRVGVPPRQILYEECVWESKLSISLPLEFVKLYRQWNNELLNHFEGFTPICPPNEVAALHDLTRLTRDNKETLEQTWEFLSSYSGDCFRKSVEKRRVAFAPVPTNLHVHYFGLAGDRHRHVITSGVAAALPLRFQNGGLTKLRASLPIHPAYSDVIFSAKRQELVEVKKLIGMLSHKLEGEWKTGVYGKPDKTCVDLQAGIKQVYARLRDIEGGLPGVARHVDALVEMGHVGDSLQNLTDNLDAILMSLESKLAALHTLTDSPSERDIYEKSAREGMACALDELLALCECLFAAQQIGRLRSLARSADSTAYVHILIRADFVFSQAATIAATAVMARLGEGWPMASGDKAADLLLLVWSWLSCYGDERGMLEDAIEAWRSVSSRLLIQLIRSPSSVSKNATPLVSGHRHCVIISLPLPQETYDALPEALRSTEYIRVCTSFWSLGVNHEANIGQQLGATVFETALNKAALASVKEYAANREILSAAAMEAMAELENQVAVEPSRKSLALFEWAMAAVASSVCRTRMLHGAGCELDGELVISCKSGKDRTAMGMTLEQGRQLRQSSGLNLQQATEVVDSLRKEGARREICRKNIGKAMYSFSPFQMHFLPKAFRPPAGTYAHGLST